MESTRAASNAAANAIHGRCALRVDTMAIVLSVSVPASLMSIRTSVAVCRRFFTSFCRQRRSSLRIEDGTSDGSRVQSGSLFNTAPRMSGTSSPSNAARPVSISYSNAPNAKMSVRLSTSFPLACSGLMYAAVPKITPAFVAARLNVGDCERLAFDGSTSNAFASPKSSTFTFPSGVTFTFAGFKSR